MPAASGNDYDFSLSWLSFLGGAVLRNLDGLDEAQARWTPDGALISVLGIVNHRTHVEWRWIDGGNGGAVTDRQDEEFHPGAALTVSGVAGPYVKRAAMTGPSAMAGLRWVVREHHRRRGAMGCRRTGAAYEIDGQGAIVVTGGTVEMVSEGRWRYFPGPPALSSARAAGLA